MNTKFDVGQRVTYPVVHTADGNITGIAVSKAGVTRYAIGPKWYAEDDLKLTAEEKAVTEPVAESKPEPVKLYCFKGHRNLLTLGKIYTVPEDGKLIFDNGDKSYYDWKSKIPSTWPENLCALVRRPAKVGEWVYIVAVRVGSEHDGYVHNGEVRFIDKTDNRIRGTHSAAQNGQIASWLWEDEYLVLDGFKGDRNCN